MLVEIIRSWLGCLANGNLTGALQPWCMKSTDAEFNVGMALGVLHTSEFITNRKLTQVYITMNGAVIPAQNAKRNSEGLFVDVNKTV